MHLFQHDKIIKDYIQRCESCLLYQDYVECGYELSYSQSIESRVGRVRAKVPLLKGTLSALHAFMVVREASC